MFRFAIAFVLLLTQLDLKNLFSEAIYRNELRKSYLYRQLSSPKIEDKKTSTDGTVRYIARN